MKLSKQDVQNLRTVLQRKLEELSEDVGFKFTVGAANYDATTVRFKVEAGVVGESGEAETREANHFKQLASRHGLKPEYLGRSFLSRGEEFTITGLARQCPKYPVLARRSGNGKTYKFSANLVRLKMTEAETEEE